MAHVILLMLFVSSSLISKASIPETILPLADTYVDAFSVDSAYGERDYLEVSDYASGLSIVALMFDVSKVSHVPNATSEIKLRLYCFYVTSPHIVGVHWCVNNTWNEENLTFVLFREFSRTAAEDAVIVDSIDVWYEWKVTNLVSKAMEENYEKITLTLEVEDPLEGQALSRYASKDQTTQEMREYSPQLVFTYLEPNTNSLDTIIKVALGLTVAVAIAFLAYKFSNRHTRKRWHRKSLENQKRNRGRFIHCRKILTRQCSILSFMLTIELSLTVVTSLSSRCLLYSFQHPQFHKEKTLENRIFYPKFVPSHLKYFSCLHRLLLRIRLQLLQVFLWKVSSLKLVFAGVGL